MLNHSRLLAALLAVALSTVAAQANPIGSFFPSSLFGGAATEPMPVDPASLPPLLRSSEPHPAVVRIVAPEEGAVSYGSGTLIDVRDQFGLVITNWHVVRDATKDVEVLFPCGFHSKARALKVDADWDLAALVIWRPPVVPVALAARAPQSGDQLTICGYGQGAYRAATGRCTKYYAPKIDFPEHMVELDVEARQGDSGGPIFNDRGELAGVLFGAGEGTTLGSFGGRVQSFLATLAPDIGRQADAALVAAPTTLPREEAPASAKSEPPLLGKPQSAEFIASSKPPAAQTPGQQPAITQSSWTPVAPKTETPTATTVWFEQLKNVFAALGAISIVAFALRSVR